MMDSVDSLQIQEPARGNAIQKCLKQLQYWEITPPGAEPLVMDFGLGEFPRVGLIEFWISNEMQAGYCGKLMFVHDGQTCPRHSHRIKHETFFVMRGKMAVTLDDESFVLGEGQSLVIEPGRVHSFSGLGPALMLELSTPCDPCDNYFEDSRIMDWLQRSTRPMAVPS
jgi:quercetin dioxygenase-like cupin family protein